MEWKRLRLMRSVTVPSTGSGQEIERSTLSGFATPEDGLMDRNEVIERSANVSQPKHQSCAKYASRGTKLECPLESMKLLELKNQSWNVIDNTCVIWIKSANI